MHSPSTATTRAAEKIIAATRRLLSQRTAPILIALDGPSGSGKSTLAGMVAEALDATIVPSDDFFAAEIHTCSTTVVVRPGCIDCMMAPDLVRTTSVVILGRLPNTRMNLTALRAARYSDRSAASPKPRGT